MFDRPASALRPAEFAAQARKRGVVLDRRTRLLYHGSSIGINGEFATLQSAARAKLRQLADRRVMLPSPLRNGLLDHLYVWYCAGWLHIAATPARR